MKLVQKIGLSIFTLLAWAIGAQAQMVYSCDFENATDRAAWILNSKPVNRPNLTLENNWYFGAPGQFGTAGQYGLYICSDTTTGKPIYQGTGNMFVTAYVDLPALTATPHTIRFDYRLAGSVTAKLDVWWVPQTVNPVSNNSPAPNYGGSKNGVKLASSLYGSATWKCFNYVFTPGTTMTVPGRLVFVWISSAGAANPPSACIDNIELFQGEGCTPAPTNLAYNDRMKLFSWSGSAAQYEVCSYNQTKDQLTPITTVNTTNAAMQFTDEGHYDLYVRSVCPDGSHSQWVQMSHFAWIPGLRCIDFFDFGASLMNTGICYVGSHTNSTSHTSLTFSNTPQVVDLGSGSPQSMHTLHTDLGEIDPNTTVNGGLKTVPDGEIASIRLGAYTNSGEDARIEYKYRVPPGQVSLVDLQYACVLNSGGHGEENPFFQLDILDAKGRQIPGCTHAYFVADQSGTAGSGWHQEGDIFWCDWKKVTFSLNKYGGQMLTIRLTASRCIFDTHFGYAYFTLNCRDGGMQGISCGDFSTDQFKAPSGDFNYRWYYQTDTLRTNVLSEDSVFNISINSDTVYVLEVINKEKVDGQYCSYELVADPNPRFPIAQVKRESITHEGCVNKVQYKNTSYVAVINRVTHEPTISDKDTIENVIWDFGGLGELQTVDSIVSFEFPAEGGQFIVTARASMSGGVCDSVYSDTLNLPNLLQATKENNIEICNGESYTYHKPTGDIVITENFTDTIFGTNTYGCEALEITNVRVLESFIDPTDTVRICDTESYPFAGRMLNKTGFYKDTLLTARGCDSILSLDLTVNPQLQATMQTEYTVCPEDGLSLPFTLENGDYDSVTIYSDMAAQAQGFLPQYGFRKADVKFNELKLAIPNAGGNVNDFVLAGDYTFEIHLHTLYKECVDQIIPVTIRVNYSSSVVIQYGSYLFLYDAENNGGYDNWVSYQWYHNNELMVGYTEPQILMPDTTAEAEYFCMITDADGNSIATCPVHYQSPVYVGFEDVKTLHVYPTHVEAGQQVNVVEGGKVEVFDAVGRLIQVEDMTIGNQTIITAPQVSGVYFLRSGSRTARIIVK